MRARRRLGWLEGRFGSVDASIHGSIAPGGVRAETIIAAFVVAIVLTMLVAPVLYAIFFRVEV